MSLSFAICIRWKFKFFRHYWYFLVTITNSLVVIIYSQKMFWSLTFLNEFVLIVYESKFSNILSKTTHSYSWFYLGRILCQCTCVKVSNTQLLKLATNLWFQLAWEKVTYNLISPKVNKFFSMILSLIYKSWKARIVDCMEKLFFFRSYWAVIIPFILISLAKAELQNQLKAKSWILTVLLKAKNEKSK